MRRPAAMAAVSCAVLLAGLGTAAPAAGSASRGTGAAAPSCAGWTDVQPPNPGFGNSLNDVAVLSSASAWAVGSYDPLNGDPTVQLIEHWNGTTWTALGLGRGILKGVAAISRTNVWAVGYSFTHGFHALIEHWDGTGWKLVAVPRHSGFLYGVAAISAANIWAMGEGGVLHWNGTAWKHVPSPNPAGSSSGNLNILDSVTAISRDYVWAVGYDAPLFRSPRKTLIEHWNGTRWKHVASPNPGDSSGNGSVLTGVTATSASNVWAVGDYSDSTAILTLTARWNGTAWKQVASPNPAGTSAFDDNSLNAVAATSAANIWAVGSWTGGALAIHRC